MSLRRSFILMIFCILCGLCACDVKSQKEIETVPETETIEETKKIEVQKATIKIDKIDISDIEDGKTYQTITYSVISCEGNDVLKKSIDLLNQSMKKNAEDFKNENRQGIRDYIVEFENKDAEYSHTSDISVMRNDKKYLSLIEHVYDFLMGAHGNYVVNGHIYDVETGEKLTVFDFVNDKETLREYLKNYVKENGDEMGAYEMAGDTIDAYINGEYELQYYIDDKDLYVVFQPYDIAPYAAGLIEIKIGQELLKVNISDI